MAVVIQQTLPFPSAALPTCKTDRWHDLLPLIRPSLDPLDTKAGIRILVDRDRLQKDRTILVAAPKPGALSTDLLNNTAVSAIILSPDERSTLRSSDLRPALVQTGLREDKDVIIIQASEHQGNTQLDDHSLLVQCKGVLAFDHVLSLLTTTPQNLRASLRSLQQLIELHQQGVHTVVSTFASKKIDGRLAIKQQESVRGTQGSRDALTQDLTGLLNAQQPSEAASTLSVHFADLGGLSRLEIYVMAGDIGNFLESRQLPFQLSHSSIIDDTDLDRGYAISISSIPSDLLPPQGKAAANKPKSTKKTSQAAKTSLSNGQRTFDDAEVRRRINGGCEAVIKAEPTITEYDTIVGDGDCGYTLRDGAKQVLRFIDGKDLTGLPEVVDDLVRDLEINMGGTSGALYCIFLTALASSLATESTIALALQAALDELLKYTRARLGDRTMMDTLIPFVETLNKTGDVAQAIADARRGVEGTKKMEAKLGRSTYLDESATQGVPDPGAYGLLVLLEGMAQG